MRCSAVRRRGEARRRIRTDGGTNVNGVRLRMRRMRIGAKSQEHFVAKKLLDISWLWFCFVTEHEQMASVCLQSRCINIAVSIDIKQTSCEER